MDKPKSHIEENFLDGPNTRLSDLQFIFSISREFLKAFRVLHFYRTLRHYLRFSPIQGRSSIL